MAPLGESIDPSRDSTMMCVFLCVLFAQPDDIFSTIEYAKTRDGRSVYWIDDRRHRIVHIRVQFDSGVGDCSSLIQQSWRDRYLVLSKKLLSVGADARFWMGGSTSFVEVSVFESREKEGLRWIRSLVDHAKVPSDGSLVQDTVTNVLYEREERVDREECIVRYQEWRKSHTPQFLLSGPVHMAHILPFLDFFWPASTPSSHQPETKNRKKRTFEPYSVVDEDLGDQVELFLLIPFPEAKSTVLSAYQHILDGFGGRLMVQLREEKGWVYDVRTKIHHGIHVLEVSTQCNIANVLAVRDELYSILHSMRTIQSKEIKRYRWARITKRREALFLGMPYLISSLHNTSEKEVLSKDMVEEFAKKINLEDSFWLLRGRERLIRQAWPVDWSHVSPAD